MLNHWNINNFDGVANFINSSALFQSTFSHITHGFSHSFLSASSIFLLPFFFHIRFEQHGRQHAIYKSLLPTAFQMHTRFSQTYLYFQKFPPMLFWNYSEKHFLNSVKIPVMTKSFKYLEQHRGTSYR